MWGQSVPEISLPYYLRAAFANQSGLVVNLPLETQGTVNPAWYTTICLAEVFDELRNNNVKRRIILHCVKPSHIWAVKTLNWLNRLTVPIWHQMTSLCSHRSLINCAINGFHRPKKRSKVKAINFGLEKVLR